MERIAINRVVSVALVLCFTFAISYAQSLNDISTPEKKRNHSLGMHAGSTTGYGVSYRYWPDKLGLQVTLFPFISSDNSYLSLGISGLMKVHELEKLDVFLYLGNHFRYSQDKYYYDFNQYEFDNYLNWSIGFGGGLNIRIAKILRLSVMTGLGNYDILNNYQLTFAGELGFYYTF